ncbi:GM18066 [Drosophila sechellia]|uniref:GM18066 n=1 Tax=Drosophila sechellia TaxID=7238 RepID=B4I175_DROSE|nr:GM18066 [Drosophila sechellia]
MGYILWGSDGPTFRLHIEMPRSCQQSPQLSVTAKDMDADGDAKDAEHADSDADATAELFDRGQRINKTSE